MKVVINNIQYVIIERLVSANEMRFNDSIYKQTVKANGGFLIGQEVINVGGFWNRLIYMKFKYIIPETSVIQYLKESR